MFSCALLLLLLGGVPPEVERIVPVSGRMNGSGWATPILPGRFLSAAHLDAPTPLYWATPWEMGTLELLWKSTKRDLAMFSSTEVLPTVKIAKELPEVQEEVFYRCYLFPGGKHTIIRGYYLGKDDDDQLQIDGAVFRGCSGSGVLNSKGELIGVIIMGHNPELMDTESRKNMDAKKLIHHLLHRDAFSNVAIAAPVVGGVPKRDK